MASWENTPFAIGNNPFKQFRPSDNTDPTFYNVPNMAWVQLIMGYAQAHFRAAIGFVSVPVPRESTSTSTSGGFFSQRVTTTYTFFAHTAWYVTLPWNAPAPTATTAQVCIKPLASCDDVGHVATALVSMQAWTGGNMPSAEQQVYQTSTSQSSSSIFSFAIITFVLVVAAVFTAGQALQAFPTLATWVGPEVGEALSAANPAAIGAIAAGSYAAGSVVASGNLSTPIQSAQQGYAGSVGFGTPQPPSSGIQAAADAATTQLQISNHPDTSGLMGNQLMFQGTCPQALTVQMCRQAGLNPGNMWRPDSYSQMKLPILYGQRWDGCVAAGYQGTALFQCAGPTADPVGGWIPVPQ